MFLADKHNFGQQVEKVQRGADTWYRKPRTVYWEWLFFGKTSPLKTLFNEKGENGTRPLADYFFNLDIEVESTWSGYAKEVATENQTPTSEHFYAFGALIAYCYIFGIRDLHKQNLIMTKTHLQAVDAEVVFTALTLPHETLLLPFKNVGYEFAGIGALVNSKEELTQAQVKQIVLGYWDLFSAALKKQTAIDKIFSGLNFSKVPVRVIVRNTSEYWNLLGNPRDNVLASEAEQLKRGDIPFYFKFISGSGLYWMKGRGLTQQEESEFGVFRRDIERHGKYEPNVGIQDRLNSRLLAQGLLFCSKCLGLNLEVELSPQVKINNKSIVLGSQFFEVEPQGRQSKSF